MLHYKAKDGFVPTEKAHGKRTLLGGKPRVFSGVTFRPYRTGIAMSEWRSDDGRITVNRGYSRATFEATVDGKFLPTRFRSEKRAFETSVATLNAVDSAKGMQAAAVAKKPDMPYPSKFYITSYPAADDRSLRQPNVELQAFLKTGGDTVALLHFKYPRGITIWRNKVEIGTFDSIEAVYRYAETKGRDW